MIDFALGFAACMAVAICAPSVFVALKAKAVAGIKRAFPAVNEMD